MYIRTRAHTWEYKALVTSLVVVMLVAPVHTALAGVAGFRNNAVGGISIDATGLVGPAKTVAKKELLALLRTEIKDAPTGLVAPVPLRMISLRGLADACEDAMKNSFGRLPEEVKFLAGIQRIQYVFVYPEINDIVLAGPGEGWRVDDDGSVVGVTTGRPVLRLDDLLVALRSVDDARTVGITCSIDPTPEGYRNLNKVLEQQRRAGRVNPAVLEPEMKRAFGPQQVTISGVPDNSHFARVLVAADYRMKRIAMHLEDARVRGLPSYLDLIKKSPRAANNANPRWWLACNYEPLAASEDRLAWELRGPGVKTMTEDDFVSKDGTVAGTGRKSPLAQKWADAMTAKYEELSVEDAVFGELRNLMDMCVVAALIKKERLWEKAGLSSPILTQADSELKLENWNAPKTVAPQVSFIKTRNTWVFTASGGVDVNSWQVAGKYEVSDSISEIRDRAATQSRRGLWWQ